MIRCIVKDDNSDKSIDISIDLDTSELSEKDLEVMLRRVGVFARQIAQRLGYKCDVGTAVVE